MHARTLTAHRRLLATAPLGTLTLCRAPLWLTELPVWSSAIYTNARPSEAGIHRWTLICWQLADDESSNSKSSEV